MCHTGCYLEQIASFATILITSRYVLYSDGITTELQTAFRSECTETLSGVPSPTQTSSEELLLK